MYPRTTVGANVLKMFAVMLSAFFHKETTYTCTFCGMRSTRRTSDTLSRLTYFPSKYHDNTDGDDDG